MFAVSSTLWVLPCISRMYVHQVCARPCCRVNSSWNGVAPAPFLL